MKLFHKSNTRKMKVRIKSCVGIPTYNWYSNFIGRVFEAEWEFRNNLLTGRLVVDGKVLLRGDCDFAAEDAIDSETISGQFSFVNDKLQFTMHTQNVSFPEVKKALLKLKEEIERQISNEQNCPYYES
jgi:hypothetical protein